MQSVELLCVCCLCCIKIIQCSCKDRRSRRVSMPFFFVVSLLCIGGLFWAIGSLDNYKQQNQKMDPNKQACSQICGGEYLQKGSYNMCCWQAANDCRSKQQCQEDWDSFFTTFIVLCKILIGCSGAYALLFVVLTIVSCIRKCRGDHAEQIIEPLMVQDEDDVRVNHSDTSSRLRQSIIVRDSNLCSICLEGYQDSKAISLDCGHMYHSECIRIWVRKHNTCPLCRGSI